MRILGLDPGLVKTGWGIIEVSGNRIAHVAHGVISPATSFPLPKRLQVLHDEVCGLIEEYRPDETAVEETFSNVNPKTTILLGHARGVVMVPPARSGMPVAEYAAKVVKKALVGTGGADKTQVAFMVRRILRGADLRSGDAADALAVAITHAHHRTAAIG
ncbi:crossover junction endodeoxyribonuclease RuvC [Sphingomonas sanguinis]|uniref:Crossover junction endodeoxyribonuclease RuvC n=1 Tax=Sphingomonas sanguinis TaxID=33051 RepID=A0A147HTE2_9SPHN|nr:crossover junction endodeoxyribonuclease RuvC [Sphingomonas sanguinis]KTT68085.1 hypothetical protein NS319_15565 [Sphingomonas sanguinis]